MPGSPPALTGPLGRALVRLASPDGPGDAHSIEFIARRGMLDDLSGHVLAHRLDAPFVDTLRHLDIEIPSRHLHRVAEYRISRLRIGAALARLAPAFDAIGVRWAVVKGPAIATRMRHPEHRAYNDLDLVVTGADFGPSIDALVRIGAEEMNRNWSAYVRHEVGEVPMRLGGVPIDLHWSLVSLGRIRRTMRMSTDHMVERRVDAEMLGGDFPVLDLVDQLIHVCVHAALSGATRLDQLRDIAVLSRRLDDSDWNTLEQRTSTARAARLVAHALDRSATVFDSATNRSQINRMGGSSLQLARWVDSTGSPTRPVLRGQLIKTARDTARSRWRARATIGRSMLAARFGNETGWDFADPRSELFHGTDAGGDAARQAFIDLAR